MNSSDKVKYLWSDMLIVDQIIDAIDQKDEYILVAMQTLARADYLKRTVLKRLDPAKVSRVSSYDIAVDESKVSFVATRQAHALRGRSIDILIMDPDLDFEIIQDLVRLVY